MSSIKQKKSNRKLDFNVRRIISQNTDPALKNGILDIHSFIKAKEFEIKQMAEAQLRSRASAKKRVFQKMPRTLRRRTASHNVKRIPRRHRARALREMSNESSSIKKVKSLRRRQSYRLRTKTISKLLKLASQEKSKINKDVLIVNSIGNFDITGINKLSPQPIGKLKFRKRQVKKVWLPTHIWSAKRCHLVTNWGYSIPLKPTQKCYRSTHRASIQDGALLWDSSFMGSLVLDGNKEEITHLTSVICNGKGGYKSGRCWEGEIFGENGLLGIGLIYWDFYNQFQNDNGDDTNTRVLIRIHPSIYTTLFEYLQTLIRKISNTGFKTTQIYDCRYSIGSIDITGPSSVSALTTILKSDPSSSLWQKLNGLADSKSLPKNITFSFNVQDPRISFPPKQSQPKQQDSADLVDLILAISDTKCNNGLFNSSGLLTVEGRTQSYINQASLKQINKQKSEKIQGTDEKLFTANNPSIPIILCKKNDNSWSLLTPWHWILPIWYSLIYLSSIKIGGLQQSHQLCCESNKLYYPDDYPFLREGWKKENENKLNLKTEWERKPPGKRIEFDSLKLFNKTNNNNDQLKGEVGDPFSNDWRYLQLLEHYLKIWKKKQRQQVVCGGGNFTSFDTKTFKRNIKVKRDVYKCIIDQKIADSKWESSHSSSIDIPIELAKVEIKTTTEMETHMDIDEENEEDDNFLKAKIIPIRLNILNRGHVTSRARIYSIPSEDLRYWLSTRYSKSRTKIQKSFKKPIDICDQVIPPIPTAEHLIGYVTSGSYNLQEGSSTGVGCITADSDRYTTSGEDISINELCIVRNVGTDVARLAKWKKITLV